MKKELNYFTVDGGLGWNQHWFRDKAMYFGGCAAVTACDLCIYLAREKGLLALYPFAADQLTRNDYIALSKIVKPYLRPRLGGIDTLQLYSSGIRKFWEDRGVSFLELVEVPGTAPWKEARELILTQIDSGMLVPYLLLFHRNRAWKDFHWHWFNLAGYEIRKSHSLVKAVTYGGYRWLDLKELWETGYERKGGFISILMH